MSYQYKITQLPPVIKVKSRNDKGTAAAAYMEETVNQQALEGWEFYRVVSIGIRSDTGALVRFLSKGPYLQSTMSSLSGRKIIVW